MQHARLFFPFKNALEYCFSMLYRRFLLQQPSHTVESHKQFNNIEHFRGHFIKYNEKKPNTEKL